MDLDSSTWAAISAVTAIITAVVAVTALLKQAALARQQARPVVVPSLELRNDPLRVAFLLKNYGPSVALNVKLSFDDELEWASDTAPGSLADLTRSFAKAIPTFAPEQSIETLYSWGASSSSEEEFAAVPTEFEGTVTYESGARRWFGRGRVTHTERFALSTLVWHYASVFPGSSDSPRGWMKQSATAATGIKTELSTIVRQLRHIIDSSASGQAAGVPTTPPSPSRPRTLIEWLRARMRPSN